MKTMRYGIIVILIILGLGYWLSVPSDAERQDNLASAEAFIDAFYSFDSDRLQKQLDSMRTSVPDLHFYQGWASGGHYQIVNRAPCQTDIARVIKCPITVKDDLMGALAIDFNVTDTFNLWIYQGRIIYIWVDSNDLPVFNDAMGWAFQKRPDLVAEPCQGFFADGPTPAACVRAMVQGFAEFAASDDFPDNIVIPKTH